MHQTRTFVNAMFMFNFFLVFNECKCNFQFRYRIEYMYKKYIKIHPRQGWIWMLMPSVALEFLLESLEESLESHLLAVVLVQLMDSWDNRQCIRKRCHSINFNNILLNMIEIVKLRVLSHSIMACKLVMKLFAIASYLCVFNELSTQLLIEF